MKNSIRNRLVYGISIIIVIFLGLGSRRYSNALPEWIGAYAGDILWALMIYLGFRFLFSTWTALRAGLISLLFSFAIELSQLYHSPWIDSIRRTTLGALVLGFGFLWSDLVCYSIGVIVGMIIDKLIIDRVG